ncbi:MAG: nucleoside recognition domain-containing protein, partial [Oscillospiraceae bacterium]
FVMELPPYRMPSPISVLRHTWEKAKGFIIKAGTIIFAMSIVIWFLQNFDFSLSMVASSADSIFASLGKLIAPIFVPLGFGMWQAVSALLTGIVAKEAVVTTMNMLFGSSAGIASAFSPLSAYTFMTFALLYMPCMAAFVTMKKELGSLSFAVKTVLAQTAIAYIVALLVHTVGIVLI